MLKDTTSATTINAFPFSENFSSVKSVEKIAEAHLPTEFGEFRIAGYKSLISDEEFVCVFKGDLHENAAIPVRIHSQCLTGDVFHSTKCDCGAQLKSAMETIEKEGRGIGIINKIRAYALQDKGADTIEANLRLGLDVDLREYDQCVEILRDLGVRKVKILSNNPDKIRAVRKGGLEVVERVPIEFKPSKNTQKYLSVKKFQMGHLLSLVN